MPERPAPDLAALAAAVVAAVERMLAAGQVGRIEVPVHGPMRSVGRPVALVRDKPPPAEVLDSSGSQHP